MPHISRKKLPKDQFDKIYKKLALIFDKAGKDKKSKVVLDQFLTSTEKVMLAKRLAVIFMLSENVSVYRISESLLVSPSTVSRIFLNYDNNKYSYISKFTKENKSAVWNILKGLLLVGLTPRAYKARQKWLKEIDKKYL